MSKKSTPPKSSECERLRLVCDKSQVIGEFLDWVLEAKDAELCAANFPLRISHEKLLAEYFDIDLKKVEKERIALMAWIRKKDE